MIYMKVIRLIPFFLGMIAVSCGKASLSETVPDVHDAVPIVLTKAEEGLCGASNQFAVSVFRKMRDKVQGADVVISPFSLNIAMSMVGEGAAGDTYDQMNDVLGWSALSKDQAGEFFRKMMRGLDTADQSVVFSSSNSIWADRTIQLHASFNQDICSDYSADSFSVDFSDYSTVGRMNNWVQDKTNGKIPMLVNAISPEERLVFINALFFDGWWSFKAAKKGSASFYGTSGTVKKEYFGREQVFPYLRASCFEMVGLPFGNGAYEMDILLPNTDKSLDDVLDEFQPNILRQMSRYNLVNVCVPSFSAEFDCGNSIAEVLREMGLTLPFSSSADFSEMSDSMLYISRILQRTRVDVSDKGADFAAATAIFMGQGGPGTTPNPVDFNVNRPFLYVFRETSTNVILIMGTLSA